MRPMRTAATLSLAAWAVLATLSPAAAAAPEDTTDTTDEHHVETFEYQWHHAHPVMSLQYGFGDPDRDGFQGDLASVGAFDLRLGFGGERSYAGEDALLQQSTGFAHVGNIASRLASDLPGPNEVGTDMWRFGLGFGDGYGYRFASDRGRFVLNGSATLGWYTLDLQGEPVGGLSPADAASLEQFTSHTRYGDTWESAVEVGFGDMFALHAGYERTAVFPSFKFWYWLLSSMIDRGALVATDLFADEVADRSPYAAPVVRFLLEGALQYGYYELRADQVNWPFDTEAPLAVDMFKLGVTTRF